LLLKKIIEKKLELKNIKKFEKKIILKKIIGKKIY